MFLFAWIPALGAVLIRGAKQVITITVLVVIAISLITWAKTHPEQSQAFMQQLMSDVMEVLPKLLNAVMALLTKFLNWLATL